MLQLFPEEEDPLVVVVAVVVVWREEGGNERGSQSCPHNARLNFH